MRRCSADRELPYPRHCTAVFTDRKLPETTWPGDDGQVQPDPDPDASTMRRVEGISDLGLLTTGQDDARGSETARRTSNRDARDWTDWMQMLAEGLWLPSYSAIVLGTFLVAFIGYREKGWRLGWC